MCAIIDANVVGEVFGDERPEAGEEFFRWINTGQGVLVVGGKLFLELTRASAKFNRWAQAALLTGRMIRQDANEVNARERQISSDRQHASNDPHVLALAQVSGARLLYTNDQDLQQDFKDRRLVNQPRGKIYSTLRNKDFAQSHKSLLSRRDLCTV